MEERIENVPGRKPGKTSMLDVIGLGVLASVWGFVAPMRMTQILEGIAALREKLGFLLGWLGGQIVREWGDSNPRKGLPIKTQPLLSRETLAQVVRSFAMLRANTEGFKTLFATASGDVYLSLPENLEGLRGYLAVKPLPNAPMAAVKMAGKNSKYITSMSGVMHGGAGRSTFVIRVLPVQSATEGWDGGLLISRSKAAELIGTLPEGIEGLQAIGRILTSKGLLKGSFRIDGRLDASGIDILTTEDNLKTSVFGPVLKCELRLNGTMACEGVWGFVGGFKAQGEAYSDAQTLLNFFPVHTEEFREFMSKRIQASVQKVASRDAWAITRDVEEGEDLAADDAMGHWAQYCAEEGIHPSSIPELGFRLAEKVIRQNLDPQRMRVRWLNSRRCYVRAYAGPLLRDAGIRVGAERPETRAGKQERKAAALVGLTPMWCSEADLRVFMKLAGHDATYALEDTGLKGVMLRTPNSATDGVQFAMYTDEALQAGEVYMTPADFKAVAPLLNGWDMDDQVTLMFGEEYDLFARTRSERASFLDVNGTVDYLNKMAAVLEGGGAKGSAGEFTRHAIQAVTALGKEWSGMASVTRHLELARLASEVTRHWTGSAANKQIACMSVFLGISRVEYKEAGSLSKERAIQVACFPTSEVVDASEQGVVTPLATAVVALSREAVKGMIYCPPSLVNRFASGLRNVEGTYYDAAGNRRGYATPELSWVIEMYEAQETARTWLETELRLGDSQSGLLKALYRDALTRESEAIQREVREASTQISELEVEARKIKADLIQAAIAAGMLREDDGTAMARWKAMVDRPIRDLAKAKAQELGSNAWLDGTVLSRVKVGLDCTGKVEANAEGEFKFTRYDAHGNAKVNLGPLFWDMPELLCRIHRLRKANPELGVRSAEITVWGKCLVDGKFNTELPSLQGQTVKAVKFLTRKGEERIRLAVGDFVSIDAFEVKALQPTENEGWNQFDGYTVVNVQQAMVSKSQQWLKLTIKEGTPSLSREEARAKFLADRNMTLGPREMAKFLSCEVEEAKKLFRYAFKATETAEKRLEWLAKRGLTFEPALLKTFCECSREEAVKLAAQAIKV